MQDVLHPRVQKDRTFLLLLPWLWCLLQQLRPAGGIKRPHSPQQQSDASKRHQGMGEKQAAEAADGKNKQATPSQRTGPQPCSSSRGAQQGPGCDAPSPGSPKHSPAQKAPGFQDVAAPSSSQAPYKDASTVKPNPDLQLFMQGEQVQLFTSSPNMCNVQLEAQGHLDGGRYAVVYLVEEKLAAGAWVAQQAAAATAAGRDARVSAPLRQLRALKVARPYELQQLVRGDELQLTKHQYVQQCYEDMRREEEMLVKAAPCGRTVNSFHRGWVEVRGHGYLPALLLEYCPGGTLEQRLQLHPEGLDYETSRRFMRNVCGALRFLNQLGIGHCDVMPGNLVIQGKAEEERVKLADLGTAVEFRKGMPCRAGQSGQRLGTQAYMAPEALMEGGLFDCRGDSWGVGCLLLHLRSGKVPWHFLKEGEEHRRGAAQLDNPASPYYSELGLTDVEKSVLRDCLADHSFRPPVEVIMTTHAAYFAWDELD
jgi:hypothetical protein